MIDSVLAQADVGLAVALDRLGALIRIPSVSADAIHDADCAKAALWLAQTLRELQFECSVHETGGKPIVLGRKAAPGNKRSVLFYGHYDVQPAEPLDLWNSDPFAPVFGVNARGGRTIVGRGSADDKGQLLTFVEACRAWLAATGALPVDVTVIFEGAEETGSAFLADFIAAHRSELDADVALICDTNMWDPATPAIVTSLRGLVQAELTVRAATMDLHSGVYGGGAENAIHVLTRLLAAMKDERNRITIPHFYDGVPDVAEAVRDQWPKLNFTAETFLGSVGLTHSAGEIGRHLIEQTQFQPTFDVNGIYGGYTGTGTKTIIPAEATAKLSFRLVGKQDPAEILLQLGAFIAERLPADCSFHLEPQDLTPAATVDLMCSGLDVARRALREEWGREPVMIGSGGSIPVVAMFKDLLGIETVLTGFGLDDDRIHSPNEKYDVASFQKGIRSWARFLGLYGGTIRS